MHNTLNEHPPYRRQPLIPPTGPALAMWPRWVRTALAAILAINLNRPSDVNEKTALYRVLALPVHHQTRRDMANQLFEAGIAAFGQNDFDDAARDFEVVEQLVPDLGMVNNIIATDWRAIGYQNPPFHPLRAQVIGRRNAEWHNMGPEELATFPEYSQVLAKYERTLAEITTQNRLTTLAIATHNLDERQAAFRRLSHMRPLILNNIENAKKRLRSLGLGNNEHGITAETNCNHLPLENNHLFACRDILLDLRRDEDRLKIVDEALAVLGNTL